MTNIYLEVGEKKVAACALEWPGWCRFAKTEAEAMQILIVYASRYKVIALKAGLELNPGEPVVVERVQGDTTTDFGAPSAMVTSDTAPLDAATAERGVALLRAAWAILDEVVAASPNILRKGPRGGGRERDEVYRHVIEAERTYARKIGVRHKPFPPGDRNALTAMREDIASVLSQPSDGSPLAPGGWPSAYALRRIAWHVIDHIWEIEDRRE
ncbi:hypothetical protein [Ktedonobacter racemifer]|uniref:Uncharacterized protein n=1 Tax=Ktedonobacter racemifer DSM 44963 TaxID=485913 RepID=D6U7P3_KTERA|nr:hypothetical protein [Ktedonobacter racemifer]EFH79904.1 hypothetical protein Krac_0429 [Ktedonobacter racemifer DSM 44963]